MSGALVLPIGLLIGISLGALGAGGSILTVPALVYLLHQPPAAATTGSLIIVGLTAATSSLNHHRAGNVRWGQGVLFAVLGVIGSFFGARLAANVEPALLLSAFAALMLLVAAIMVHRLRVARRAAREGVVKPGLLDEGPLLSLHPFMCRCQKVALLLAVATGVGLLTGFFGVGGGFAVVPALVLALGLPMQTAVGTSLVVIASNSAIALTFRLGNGVQLDWFVILGFALFAIIGGAAGGRIAKRVNANHLSIAFVTVLVLIAGYTAWQNLPQVI